MRIDADARDVRDARARLPSSPVFGAVSARKPSLVAPGGSPPGAPTAEGPSAFARLLHGLGAEVERGESLARATEGAARRSVELAPVDLIALEASVYRYSEAVDLAARLVDRSTGAVKAVLQGS